MRWNNESCLWIYGIFDHKIFKKEVVLMPPHHLTNLEMSIYLMEFIPEII